MSYPDVKAALGARRVTTTVRVEIQDADGTWVDVSDRFTANRLISLGSGFVASLERETGAFDVQLSTITVWNGDRFWDWYPPPNEVFDTPNFPSSFTWKGLLCRVFLTTMGGEEKLGPPFVIDRVTTKARGDSATITLKSLKSFLTEAQADRVKNGSQWWQNKPTGFLVRRLLETRHPAAEVASWPGIQTSYQIPTSRFTGDGGIAVSAFARPPETDRDYQIYGNPIACNNNSLDAGFGDTWVGLEEELWKFNPTTGDWTYWSTMPAALVALGYKIHHVYVSTLRQKIVCLAWVPDFPTANLGGDLSGSAGNAIVTHSNVVVLTASMTAAPAFLTEQAVAAVLNYYTGMFSIRAGKAVPLTGLVIADVAIGAPLQGITTPDSKKSGINMPNPTPHWKRCQDETPAGAAPYAVNARALFSMNNWNGSIAAVDDGAMHNVNSPDFWQTELGAYHSWSDDNAQTYPADYRHSIGQSAGAFAFDEASDTIVMSLIGWNPGLARYTATLATHNIQTGVGGAAGVTTYRVMSGNEEYLPSSMRFNKAGTKLLVTAHMWMESAWSGTAPIDTGNNEPMGAAVIEFDWPLVAGAYANQPAQTLHFLNTNFATSDAKNRRRWIPLEAAYSHHTSGTRYAGITFLDYSKVGGACWGACLIQLGSTNTSDVRMSTGRQSGMALWDGFANFMVWNDAGANALVNIGDGTLTTPVLVDQGTSPVDGDPGLAAGLVWNASLAFDVTAGTGGMMGISAPGLGTEQDPDVQKLPANGKIYLFQCTYSMTDRVELADYGGMSIYDALVQLAAVGDFVQGYDDDGRYFFRQRVTPTAAIATIKFGPNVFAGEIQATDATKDWGWDDVFNYVEIAPSRVILRPPTGTARMLERPPGWINDPWNGEISVVQRSLRKVHLVLRCVEGGILGDEVRGVIRNNLAGDQAVLHVPGAGEFKDRVRFAWLIQDVVIETQLLEEWLANSTHKTIVIPYQAGFQVERGSDVTSAVSVASVDNYGDQVEIGDLVTRVRDVVHDPAGGTTTLTLANYTVTGDRPLPVGTRVVIRTMGNNQWSNSELGIAVAADAAHTPGAEDAVTTFVANATRNFQPGTILRTRLASSPVGDPEHLVTEVVNGTDWKGRRLGSGGDALAIAQYAPIRGYLAPIIDPTEFPDGHVFWIGDTGLGLIFRVEARQDIFRGLVETPFMVGDEIDVTAEGLVLDEQELDKAIGNNNDSQAKFRTIPYRSARSSKFLNLRRARELAQRIVVQYGFPRYRLEVDLPLTFVPKLEDCYLVEDHEILPWTTLINAQGDDASSPVAPDTARAIAFTVRGYTIDPIQGRLRVSLRAVNPHAY